MLTMRFYLENEKLYFEIIDNGKGFDTEYAATGAGLRNAAMRATLLEGTFDIRSDKGVGTTFTVECPISVTYVSTHTPSQA